MRGRNCGAVVVAEVSLVNRGNGPGCTLIGIKTDTSSDGRFVKKRKKPKRKHQGRHITLRITRGVSVKC